MCFFCAWFKGLLFFFALARFAWYVFSAANLSFCCAQESQGGCVVWLIVQAAFISVFGIWHATTNRVKKSHWTTQHSFGWIRLLHFVATKIISVLYIVGLSSSVRYIYIRHTPVSRLVRGLSTLRCCVRHNNGCPTCNLVCPSWLTYGIPTWWIV